MVHYRLKDDPLGSHQQIAGLVRELRREPILDVGSAQGMMGQLLRDDRFEIDAVEPHPEWAAMARPFYKTMYQGQIEQVDLPRSRYQVVICADVLEHTVNPVAVLKKLRDAATRDATFIISLPNIAHISVRLLLLFGYFPKMNRGLLDRTHLHCYTRDTARHMLENAGLKVQRRLATLAPLSEVWPNANGHVLFRALWHAQSMALRMSTGLFAYQWILVAQPAEAVTQVSRRVASTRVETDQEQALPLVSHNAVEK
jgi:2-polyprenyl-3-methyl-5-hydroxy-6-metoxy-1,4-benzoquinol methylase